MLPYLIAGVAFQKRKERAYDLHLTILVVVRPAIARFDDRALRAITEVQARHARDAAGSSTDVEHLQSWQPFEMRLHEGPLAARFRMIRHKGPVVPPFARQAIGKEIAAVIVVIEFARLELAFISAVPRAGTTQHIPSGTKQQPIPEPRTAQPEREKHAADLMSHRGDGDPAQMLAIRVALGFSAGAGRAVGGHETWTIGIPNEVSLEDGRKAIFQHSSGGPQSGARCFIEAARMRFPRSRPPLSNREIHLYARRDRHLRSRARAGPVS